MNWLRNIFAKAPEALPVAPMVQTERPVDLIAQREAIQGNQTIIFLHIPKTAGATLRQFIDQNYDRSRVFDVLQRSRTSPEALAAMPEDEKRRIQLIYGHFYFGLHDSLPQRTTYLTMLRDPVNRVLSHYYYVIKTPMHRLHQRVVSERMTLEDYIHSKLTDELDNGQVRMLSGIPAVPIGECSPEMLRLAKDNLVKHFTAVGLTERFDDSLRLFARVYQWKPAAVQSMNVNEKRQSKNEIPPNVLRWVEKMNELDMDLYAFVEKTFGKELDRVS